MWLVKNSIVIDNKLILLELYPASHNSRFKKNFIQLIAHGSLIFSCGFKIQNHYVVVL